MYKGYNLLLRHRDVIKGSIREENWEEVRMASAWMGLGMREKGENDWLALLCLDVKCIGFLFLCFLQKI